jgi:hypothetical protein
VTAIEELQAYVDSQPGLVAIHFTRGSDDNVTTEEAAAVALAMLRYVPAEGWDD